jgi:hypothetical protein
LLFLLTLTLFLKEAEDQDASSTIEASPKKGSKRKRLALPQSMSLLLSNSLLCFLPDSTLSLSPLDSIWNLKMRLRCTLLPLLSFSLSPCLLLSEAPKKAKVLSSTVIVSATGKDEIPEIEVSEIDPCTTGVG